MAIFNRSESELRQLVVSKAREWIGLKTLDDSYWPIIQLYNGYKPLPRGYAVKRGDAWCATFVSAVGIASGLTEIMPRECSCPNMIELYRNLGCWMERDDYVPLPGDIILYDWQDSGNGDNMGTADHIGIVETVVNGTITVIEGNMNNAVGRRNIAVNGRYIRGYCLPDYKSLVRQEKSYGNPSGWAEEACKWAVDQKIFSGDGHGNFDWQEPITREQVAQILYNMSKQEGK